MLDLRAKNAGYVRRIEELENQIFILEDQLDSRRLAAEQKAPATLPARVLRGERPPAQGRLAPRSSPGSAAASEGPSPGPFTAATSVAPLGLDEGSQTQSSVQTSIVAEHAVDYAGDAAQGAPTPRLSGEPAGAPRPVLRLSPASPVRERALHPGAWAAPEPLAGGGPPALPSPDPLRVYREALETLRAGRPDVALAGFRRFLEANPAHDYADNAQYWIGECHYDQHQYRAAERAFRNVVERYPHGNKVPDAMLKLGFTLQALGDAPGGRSVLESLARAFPKHEAARLASERLAHPESPAWTGGLSAATLGTVVPLPLVVPAAPSSDSGRPPASRR